MKQQLTIRTHRRKNIGIPQGIKIKKTKKQRKEGKTAIFQYNLQPLLLRPAQKKDKQNRIFPYIQYSKFKDPQAKGYRHDQTKENGDQQM
jgi:hypothetical protein